MRNRNVSQEADTRGENGFFFCTYTRIYGWKSHTRDSDVFQLDFFPYGVIYYIADMINKRTFILFNILMFCSFSPPRKCLYFCVLIRIHF